MSRWKFSGGGSWQGVLSARSCHPQSQGSVSNRKWAKRPKRTQPLYCPRPPTPHHHQVAVARSLPRTPPPLKLFPCPLLIAPNVSTLRTIGDTFCPRERICIRFSAFFLVIFLRRGVESYFDSFWGVRGDFYSGMGLSKGSGPELEERYFSPSISILNPLRGRRGKSRPGTSSARPPPSPSSSRIASRPGHHWFRSESLPLRHYAAGIIRSKFEHFSYCRYPRIERHSPSNDRNRERINLNKSESTPVFASQRTLLKKVSQ